MEKIKKHKKITKQASAICLMGFVLFTFLSIAKNVAAESVKHIFPVSFSDGRKSKIYLPFDEIGSITTIDLGIDGTDEILIGSPMGTKGEVYLVRQDGSLINYWNAYDEKFSGGVSVASGDLDGDFVPEIITAPKEMGGPHIRIFNGYGETKINPGFFAEEQGWRGKIEIYVKKFTDQDPPNIAALMKKNGNRVFKIFSNNGQQIKSYPVPKNENTEEEQNTLLIGILKNNTEIHMELPKKVKSLSNDEKTIIIDLSEQKLSYYENGYRINSFSISSGKTGYKTPQGEFSIINKIKTAYSKNYGLYMPYWMAFTTAGHGIHELPYWSSGYREGEGHLGQPVSHGCVRLGIGSAKEVFDWAQVGTKVIVQE